MVPISIPQMIGELSRNTGKVITDKENEMVGHHKSHMYCPGTEPGLLRMEAGLLTARIVKRKAHFCVFKLFNVSNSGAFCPRTHCTHI